MSHLPGSRHAEDQASHMIVGEALGTELGNLFLESANPVICTFNVHVP